MLEETKVIIEALIGQWGWLLAAAIGSVAFKDTASKFWLGMTFLLGNDFNVDDIVYINGTKKARIVRQSLNKTTFYVYDHHRKFIVPNDRIWSLNIEKTLPKENNDKNL